MGAWINNRCQWNLSWSTPLDTTETTIMSYVVFRLQYL